MNLTANDWLVSILAGLALSLIAIPLTMLWMFGT